MQTAAVVMNRVDSVLAQLAKLGVQATGVADDSRQVRPGDIFLAYPGDLADGRCYVADALARGAAAVLWEASPEFSWNTGWAVVNLPVQGVRSLCGPLAHTVFGRPSERLSLIGITGTNGKTTVSQWLARCYPRPCAVIGTLGAGLPGRLDDTGFTTPEATTLMRYLAAFSDAGVQACALEVSSIGIEEGRLDGARVDVAVFTNLTRDHLDYHGNMEDYAAAKERLFAWPRLRLAVINLDDPFGRELATRSTASKVIGYTQLGTSCGHQGVVSAENVTLTPEGLRFRLCTPNGRVTVETGLIGRFNVSNLLAVAAVLLDAGMTPKEIALCFSDMTSPPGRLEKLGGHNEPLVVVDYAHTPDALENALLVLREAAVARGAGLVCVFGCGGDRDRGKRPLMGDIAARHADRIVLTSDNPRSEDAQTILSEIRAGVPEGVALEVVVERAEAIARAVAAAAPGDVILLAGKGHESYQEIAGVRYPFSDAVEASAALAARREVQA